MKLTRLFTIALLLLPTIALTAQAPPPPAPTTEAAPTIPPSVASIPVDQQATRDDVLQLIEVMHVKSQMEQMVTMLTTAAQKQVQQALDKDGSNLTPAQKAALEQHLAGAATIYPVSEMIDDIVPIYQRHLTRDDTHAIVAFYTSPAGQHMIKEMPALMQDVMKTLMPKVQERAQAYQRQTQQESTPPTPPSPTPTTPPTSK